MSKLFDFFYLGVSILFLFNQVYKLFILVFQLYLCSIKYLNFFFLIWCVNFIFIQSNVSTLFLYLNFFIFSILMSQLNLFLFNQVFKLLNFVKKLNKNIKNQKVLDA